MTPEDPTDVDMDAERTSAVDGAGSGARRASRRAVIGAAAAALGAVGVAACSTPTPAGSGSSLPPGGSARGTGTPDAPSQAAHTSGSRGTGGVASGTAAPVEPAHDTTLGTDGPDVRSGPHDTQRVALTFHGAGPAALTAAVLDIARAHGARLTVFAVGQWLHANPTLGHAILAGGHDLGNHTWSHRPMRRLSAAEARSEVSRGAAAVAAVRGSAGPLFRPSGTPTSNAVIRAAARASGYHRCISYDVDPQDFLDPGTTAVRDRTLAALRGGSIVSLHLGHAGTVAALPGILDGMRVRGLSAVTVTDLLG